MKTPISFLLLLLVFSSCSPRTSDKPESQDTIVEVSKPVVNSNDSSSGKPQPHLVPFTLLGNANLVGDFNGDGRADTIVQHNISAITHLPIDSIPDGDWYAVADYLNAKQSDIFLTSSIPLMDTLHLGPGLGLFCMINIGDTNGDKKDEIAVVVDVNDFSNENSCTIYSICNNTWTSLKGFAINEGVFKLKDTPLTFNSIPGFLERQKGHWVYRDYEKVLNADEEVKMERVKLNGCNGRQSKK